jgi:hypothetical protein
MPPLRIAKGHCMWVTIFKARAASMGFWTLMKEAAGRWHVVDLKYESITALVWRMGTLLLLLRSYIPIIQLLFFVRRSTRCDDTLPKQNFASLRRLYGSIAQRSVSGPSSSTVQCFRIFLNCLTVIGAQSLKVNIDGGRNCVDDCL